MKLVNDREYFHQQRLQAKEVRKNQGFSKIQSTGDLKSKIASLVKMYQDEDEVSTNEKSGDKRDQKANQEQSKEVVQDENVTKK